MSDNNTVVSIPTDIFLETLNDVKRMREDIASIKTNSLNTADSIKRLEVSSKEEYAKISQNLSDHDKRLTDVEKKIVGWTAHFAGVAVTASFIFVVGFQVAKILGWVG